MFSCTYVSFFPYFAMEKLHFPVLKFILISLKPNCEIPLRKKNVINELKAIDNLIQWINGRSWEDIGEETEQEMKKERVRIE